MSWRSVMHMCFLAFSHQYKHKFIPKATDYFSHASTELRGENALEKISPQPGLKLTNTRPEIHQAHH